MAFTKKSTRVDTLNLATSFDNADAATSVACQAVLRTRVANDADASESGYLANKQVNFNLLASPVSTTNYTAAGKTVNGVQFAALARQIALDEATRQGI